MNYRSFDDLYKTIIKGAEKLPEDIDLVVGVPRSGLLAANILALYKNIPMTDLEGLAEKRLIAHGNRLKKFGEIRFESLRKVLIIDDSSISGRAIAKTKAFVEENRLDTAYDILYGVVFSTKGSCGLFDVHFDLCSAPRVFDWNIFHHDAFLKDACVDIDGVLCRDPSDEENDDGERYREFLLNVAPKLVPKETIGYLVTNRLEKYRPETEAWLRKHNIKFRKLYMSQHASKAARIAAADHHLHKAKVYAETNAPIFIESSYEQAKGISKVTGKKVYCTDALTMVAPPAKRVFTGRVNYTIGKLLKLVGLGSWLRSLAKSQKQLSGA